MPTNPQQYNQEFTENTEVDRQRVTENITSSSFFNTYYNSLEDIEFYNNQLLNSQDKLRSYTSNLHEVDRLADQAGIPNSSTIILGDLPRRIAELNQIIYESNYFTFFVDELLHPRSQSQSVTIGELPEVLNVRSDFS